MEIFDTLFGKTKNVMQISCGVLCFERDTLIEAARLAGEYVRRFCGGGLERLHFSHSPHARKLKRIDV